MNKNTKSRSSLRQLVRATRGANMVEYIILVGVVALLAVVGFSKFSGSLQTTVQSQGKTIEDAKNAGASSSITSNGN